MRRSAVAATVGHCFRPSAPRGGYLAVDRDREAVAAARARLAADTRVVVRQGRFAELSELLAQEEMGPVERSSCST